MTNQKTNTQNATNAPVATHRDGAVSSKVWRNFTKDGEPYYSTTFQRTYTDPRTGNPAETHSFGGTDVLKIQQLASEAYRTIGQMKAQDKNLQQSPQQEPLEQQQGLAEQRDAAMNNAAPTQNQGPVHAPTPER